MNCETAKDLIQPYLEGRLAALERNEFVYHVTECGVCESEVIAYRDVFARLREMPRFETPQRLSVAVLAELRAEGFIHDPKFPAAKRALDGFLELPARVRYPVAAVLVVGALYAPVAAALGLARGSVVTAAESMARALVWAQAAFSGVFAADRLSSGLEAYARAAKTVLQAGSAALSEGGGAALALWLAVAGAVAAIAAASRFVRSKGSSGHATFCC